MSTNRLTKFLLIALVIASAFVTMSSLAFAKKSVAADRSFDAVEQVRLSRFSAPASPDLSYEELEKLRISRSMDTSWYTIEEWRLKRSLESVDRSYDSIEAIRSLRTYK